MQEMEACWPSSVGLSGAGAKSPCAALAEDRRGERQGEGAAIDRVRWGPGRRSRIVRLVVWSGVVVEASKGLVDIETGGPWIAFGKSLAGARVIGQVVSGVEAA